MGHALKNDQKKQRRDQRDAYRETEQLVSEFMKKFFGDMEDDDERFETR